MRVDATDFGIDGERLVLAELLQRTGSFGRAARS